MLSNAPLQARALPSRRRAAVTLAAMQHSDAAALRPRAAFLHVAKCAGTSVRHALVTAAGDPPQPPQQFDGCYVDGIGDPAVLGADVRTMVAWDDHPVGVGTHVFATHWSLPTLRRHFEAPDIATVLREPMTRVLSYVEYVRSLPSHLHRQWYPHTVPMDLARLPLVEVLQLPAASRATDSLITRQVLWGDPRLPTNGFIATDDAPLLAADAIGALSALGAVALVEQGHDMWHELSTWLGVRLAPTRDNETPRRQLPGILRSGRDIVRATELLLARTESDRVVWQHFAQACGLHDPTSFAEEAVERRLTQWSATAFFAGFALQHPPAETLAVSNLAAALDGALPDTGSLLTVHLPDTHHLSLRGRHVTAVVGPGDRFPHAHEVIELAHADVVDLRDTLTGRDFDEVLVGRGWCDLASPDALFAQLAEVALPRTRLLVVADSDHSARAERLARNAGWHDVMHLPLPGAVLVAGRRDGEQQSSPASHYGVPFALGDPNDSRSLVVEMLGGATTVLELGCSEGLTTRVLAGRGQQVVGVEIDPVAAAAARPFAEQVLVADLDSVGALDALGDRTFEAVAVADVLEHLRDPAAALRRALRHLAPHGHVVLSVPNMAHADVRMALLDGRVPYADLGLLDRTHVHWFTLEGLRRLLADSGLVAVEWRRVVRSPGTTEVPLDDDLRRTAHTWFADDPDATTYQWVVRCQREGEGVAAPDPAAATHVRRFLPSPATGVGATLRSLAASVLRRRP